VRIRERWQPCLPRFNAAADISLMTASVQG